MAGSQSKHPMFSCILSFYVFLNGLHATNFKNKLRTIQPQNLGKIKNSQPEHQFSGSYRKEKSIHYHFIVLNIIIIIGIFSIIISIALSI